MSIILDYGCGNDGCYWNNIDPPTEQNFGSKDRGNTFILNCCLLILFINIFIYCCINISSEKNIKRDSFLKWVWFINCIYIFGYTTLLYHRDTIIQRSVCEYNYYCEIVNNTLMSYKYYYLTDTEECLDYSELSDLYFDNNYDKPDYINNYCGTSEYGCCRINNRCEFSFTTVNDYEYHTNPTEIYNHYLNANRYTGYATISVYKENEEGSNCPTIKTIILDYVNNIKINYIYISVVIYVLIIIIISYIIYCYLDNEYFGLNDLEQTDLERGNRKPKSILRNGKNSKGNKSRNSKSEEMVTLKGGA
tara:strand:+ start:1875 stop:2792 length:918 start_codon:yes stop_codon:yes gene_type:complete